MASKPALPNLTTIRLIAAMYVFCYHFIHIPFLSLGFTGVNLFFVLSGFILSYNYPTVPSPRKFYAYRFARIYPLYALSLLLSLPTFLHIALGHDVIALWALPLAFTMTQTWWPPMHSLINAAAWTLSVEAFFYICFPFLAPWVARQVHHWKQWTITFCVLLVLPFLLYFFVLKPHFPAYDSVMNATLIIPVFYLGEFLVGMFLGLHYLKARPVFKSGHAFLAFAFLLACLTAASHLVSDNTLRLFDDGLLTLPYAILILTLAGWQSRWFSHPLLQLGGEISYGVYLLQFPVTALLRITLHQAHPSPWLAAIATILAAYLGYLFIEKPMRVIVLRWLGFHPSAKPIPTPGLQV